MILANSLQVSGDRGFRHCALTSCAVTTDLLISVKLMISWRFAGFVIIGGILIIGSTGLLILIMA